MSRCAVVQGIDGRHTENVRKVQVRGDELGNCVNNRLVTRIRNRFAPKTFRVALTDRQRVTFVHLTITRR
ncbi:MAG: hypothetical protein A4E73_03768 [Syntrophaceae bacterium PtaU1.Bin231]|nr:MAG: hypothetical protein A4E73_03768 [Syntrophaceae bacterium PtaU1.Bin231]